MGSFVTQVDESIAIIGQELDTCDNQPHEVLLQRLVERRDGCCKSVGIEAVVVKYPLQFLSRFILTALIDVHVHFVH
jgi:hypothetical protein